MCNYEWFLEPLNEFANNALASELEFRCDESLERETDDNFGLSHNLIRVDFKMVKFILGSQDFRDLFRVFNRRGGGKVRDVTDVVRKWGRKNKRRACSNSK